MLTVGADSSGLIKSSRDLLPSQLASLPRASANMLPRGQQWKFSAAVSEAHGLPVAFAYYDATLRILTGVIILAV